MHEHDRDESCSTHDCHTCDCTAHGGADDDNRSELWTMAIAAALFVLGLAVAGIWSTVLLFLAYLLIGSKVLWSALRNVVRGQVFDENLLMAVASVGAIAIGEIPEAVGVMLFYSVGEYLQHAAVARSRKSIENLMNIRPDRALVFRGANEPVEVPPDDVIPGETVLVRPGERIPLDGVVTEGETSLDTSALTGESMPRPALAGSEVLAGMVNLTGTIRVVVARPYAESSVARILELVQQAANRKARTEQFITKFARYYTPAVVGLALLVAFVPPLIMPDQSLYTWIHRALVMLVISCPCALVISIPLGYFAGIGGASRRGVLVKGANYLEALARVDTVIFDKTGTLTQGSFNVVDVVGENGYTELEVLKLAAHAGAHSSHPVSTSIRNAYERSDRELDLASIGEAKELTGMGVSATVRGERVLAGNDRLLHQENIQHDVCVQDGTVVNVAHNHVLAGRIHLADEVKPGATEGISRLRRAGVGRIVMLTGDTEGVALDVAGKVGIREYRSGLLPQEKVEALENIMAEQTVARGQSGVVAFAGDGINDAPALMRADIGIAMGALGSDAAIEAADVVVMDDDPSRVADAIDVARRTRRVVVENIVLAVGVKIIVLVLGALGIATMWAAVFADVGVAVIAVANSMRAYGIGRVRV